MLLTAVRAYAGPESVAGQRRFVGGDASTTWMAASSEVAIRDRRLQVRESAVEVTSWSPM